MERATVCGVVLAAGAGSRFGGPKSLARDADGVAWPARAVEALRAGGCGDVIVVLGAEADAARPLVPDIARVVVAQDWALGLSRSLITALVAAAPAQAAVIIPVDTPELPAVAVERVIAVAGPDPASALVRAAYRGAPGHPVLLGAAHWSALTAEAVGDSGAGRYLRRHHAQVVDCADLWSGRDLDTRDPLSG